MQYRLIVPAGIRCSSRLGVEIRNEVTEARRYPVAPVSSATTFDSLCYRELPGKAWVKIKYTFSKTTGRNDLLRGDEVK